MAKKNETRNETDKREEGMRGPQPEEKEAEEERGSHISPEEKEKTERLDKAPRV